MAGMSLEEYVNAYYGGMLGISKEYGIRKDDAMDTGKDKYLNTMYGAKVFNQLNNESSIFKLLPKQPWNTSGWRVLKTRTASASNAGIAEGATFPATDVPDLEEMEVTMKEIVSPWDITTRASLLSKADDGLGDIEAFLRDNAATDHAYYIDQMLIAQSSVRTANNFESLDRIISANAELAFSAVIAAGELDPWELAAADRDSDATNDAYVSQGDTSSTRGDARLLTLELVDGLIRNALENGAKYENLIFLTGYSTLEEFKRLVSGSVSNATWRFMMESQAPKAQGGVKSQPGMNLDSRVGYYDSIPMFVSQHVPISSAAGGTLLAGAEVGIEPLYLLDMEHLYMKLAVPTTYVSNEDLGVTQKLAREYAFITGGELVCTKFASQGKVRDLYT